jgi:hypothetical protein
MTENVLIRTRPVRIAGRNNQMVGNILLCLNGLRRDHLARLAGLRGRGEQMSSVPTPSRPAKRSILFGAQTTALDTMASGNQVVDNIFHQTRSGRVFEIRPEEVASAVTSSNTLFGTISGQKLCP